MAKNRRYRSAAIRFGPALKAFLLCLLLGGSGVGYVWQKNQIFELGKQIKQREATLGNIEKQNDKLKQQLAMMRSPVYLNEKIRDLKIGLVQPTASQMWRLPEPGRELPAAEAASELAGNEFLPPPVRR